MDVWEFGAVRRTTSNYADGTIVPHLEVDVVLNGVKVGLAMANWLTLIIVGLAVSAFTLIPPFPPGWRPFAQAVGGIMVGVGLLLLLLSVLGIRA